MFCLFGTLHEKWDALKRIAQLWIKDEPTSIEAFYYAALAEDKLGNSEQAKQYYQQTLSLHPDHPAAIAALKCNEKITLACNDKF